MSKSSRHTAGVLYNLNNNRMNVICSVLAILGMMGMVGMVGCSLAEPCEYDKGQTLIDGKCQDCPTKDYHFHDYYDEEEGKQKHICEEDSVAHCGANGNDCKNIKGAQGVECTDGKCIINSCEDAYDFITGEEGSKYCRPATVDKCGDDEKNCNDLPGVEKAECYHGECRIISCMADYKSADKDGIQYCMPSTAKACGGDNIESSTDCTQIDEVKAVQCVDGKCQIDSCNDGYEPVNKDETQYCMSVTVDKCGDDEKNCNALPGVQKTECSHGECVVKECEDDYELKINNSCVLKSTLDCGEGHMDCYDEMTKIYKDGYKNIVVPSCTDSGQCVIADCNNFVDENNKEYNTMLISCAQYEQYKSSYVKENEDFMPICNEQGKENFKFCLPYQCAKDSKTQKIIPGVCGCDKEEDTKDSDGDGEINCFDDCPNNPTKTTLAEGDECIERDTDRDGINDKEDICPTRNNKDPEVAKLISSMSLNEKCDAEGRCSTEINAMEKAKLCNIYITNSDGIDEFHVYNAKDLEVLGIVLNSINNDISCVSNDKSMCSGKNIGKKCVDGYYRSYKYKAGTESAYTNCMRDLDKDTTNDPPVNTMEALDFTQLKVILENDINLNDINGTIMVNNQCHGALLYIQEIIGVDFDGKDNVIKYFSNDYDSSALRCDLTNPLFDKIILSSIHDLKLNFGLSIGSGRGLIANQMITTSLKNIEIINGKVETTALGENGVGLLAGSYNMSKSIPPKISVFAAGNTPPFIENITAHNVSVIANSADNVGGLFGQFNASDVTLSLSNYTINQIQGNNNVGGLIGYADGVIFNDIQFYCDNSGEKIDSCVNLVQGKNYVGGIIGGLNNSIYKNIKVECQVVNDDNKSCVNSVLGNDYVGGVVGRFVGSMSYNNAALSSDTIVHNIHEVKGENYIGGLAGYVSNVMIKSFNLNNIEKVTGTKNYVGGVFGFVAPTTYIGADNIILKISSDVITGNDYVGGVVGYCQYCRLEGTVNAQTGSVRGNKGVGGILGEYDNYTHDHRINRIYNKVSSVSGNHGVGGVIGGFISDSIDISMSEIYNQVSIINRDGEVPSNFGGLIGEILFNSSSMSNGLNVSLNKVYDQVNSFTPGMNAGGLIGSMHEIDNDSNTFKHANITINDLHAEIDAYNVHASDDGGNGGILSKLEGNKVTATSASIFINYLLSNDKMNSYGALFQDENTAQNGNFVYTNFRGAFSVKRTDNPLTSCGKNDVPFCSKTGLGFALMCHNSPQLEDSTCKYYMRGGSETDSWTTSFFKLGGTEEAIPSLSNKILEELTASGVIPSN